jgi:hypothetical protein
LDDPTGITGITGTSVGSRRRNVVGAVVAVVIITLLIIIGVAIVCVTTTTTIRMVTTSSMVTIRTAAIRVRTRTLLPLQYILYTAYIRIYMCMYMI